MYTQQTLTFHLFLSWFSLSFSLFLFSLRDVAVLVGLAAVLLGLSSLSAGAWSLAVIPWCAAVMGWVGLRGAGLWRQGRMQRAAHAQASELQTMVLNSKALTSLARKSLRLLQETEVISRGFTL